MEDYPRTILEFEERFNTDEACRQYLAQLRWPEGFRQGYRTLNRCPSKNLHQEVDTPAGDATFHNKALLGGVLLD